MTPEPDAEPQVDAVGHEQVIAQEESIEYRDDQGNLLNEEQVAALEGKASFQTKYETRTRLVDEAGNELGYRMPDGRVQEGSPPPHPDVDNVDQSTLGVVGEEKNVAAESPPTVDAAIDKQKQSSILAEEKKRTGEARPGSERDEATGKASA